MATEKRPKGVPESARLVRLASVDFLKTVNALLKDKKVRVRTKAYQRGGGCPTWIWTEDIPKEE